MDFISEDLSLYCENHSTQEDALLRKIDRETQLKVLKPRMLSGALQGKMLELFTKMINPKIALEIGTYTGYSAICIARGLGKSGKLITMDINDELETMVREFFEESGLAEKIDYRLGNALDILPDLEGPFDMVFIDADKINNEKYFDLIIDKTSQGGIIMADNVLWSGKVLVKKGQKIDKDTKAILDFNAKINEDPRVENVLLPIRDGIMMARKL
ncbi:putative O-methyltransferase YrrM [Algoriphagus iocasae]|uniref:Putative O-methyltransferase YrrM n=1 Tax=Algoriphagus iocasae TaxID=1836499 RepID=A0A841MI03_9BACT|nr:O-methyltransferase [Algoriphagus iocasae]MBB6324514.1 putative O-methyltransferase YrrM [Algoriphagus iocasae]